MTGGHGPQDGADPRPARPVTLPAQHQAVPRPAVPASDGSAPDGSASAGVATAVSPHGTGVPGAPDRGEPAAPARKRADHWKAAFFVLAVLAIIAGVTWALLGSKFLVVRSITVNGAPDIPRSQVITASGVRPGTPLIRISTGKVARRVEQLTLVESARVTRSWPNAITITIVERTAAL